MTKIRSDRTPRQRNALLWGALLTASTAQTGQLAGREGLLGAALAIPGGLLLGLLWRRSYRNSAGPGPVWRVPAALWLLFAGGVLLRAGADRLVASVYPESPEWLFAALLLLPSALAGLGRRRTLGRTAELAAPALGALLALVLVLSLPALDPGELTRRGGLEIGEILSAFGRMLGLLALAVSLFPPEAGEGTPAPGALAWTAAAALLLAGAVTLVLGRGLAREMSAPVFVLIRNLRPGHLPERAEALAAGMWVITDYLCLAAVLQTAPRALFRASYGPAGAKTPWPGLGCAAAVGLTAWGCAASSFALEGLTGTILPLGNAAAAALLLAGAALGKRKSPPSL